MDFKIGDRVRRSMIEISSSVLNGGEEGVIIPNQFKTKDEYMVDFGSKIGQYLIKGYKLELISSKNSNLKGW